MARSSARTLWAALSALLVVGGATAQAADTLNLNGLWWTDDDHLVRITHRGDQVRAVFVAGADCPNGGTRSYYLQGQLQGKALEGKLVACTREPRLVTDCGLEPVYETTFEATVSPDSITGTRFAEGWAYDTDDSGKFANCRRDAQYDREIPISLTPTTCAEALRKAEEEFRKWMGIWRDQGAASDEMGAEALKAYDEGSALLEQQVAEDLWSLFPIPVKVYTADTPEDAVDIAVDVAEETAKKVNPGDPVWARRAAKGLKKAGLIDFIVDWGFTIANALTVAGEGDNYSQSADELGEAARAALRKAIDYGLLVEALKQECPPEPPPGGGAGAEADDPPLPSTRDLGESVSVMDHNAAARLEAGRYAQAEIEAYEALQSDLSQAKAVLSQVPEGGQGSPAQGAEVAGAILSALEHFAEAARAHGALLAELKRL